MQARKTGNGVGLAELLNMHTAPGRRRVMLSIVQAAAFGPIAGWGASGAWLILYVIVRAMEARALDPRQFRVFGPRPKLVVTLGMLRGAVHGLLAVAAVVNGGLWGLACGTILLSGGLLYAVVSSQRSKAEYAMLATPPLLCMFTVAVLGAAKDHQYAYAISFIVIVLALMSGAQTLWTRRADDIAADTLASDESERRRLAAENSAAAKSAFVAAVSHELRTPISAILAGAGAIERVAGADAETRANAALIAEAGEMMRTLLNDLLDLSKMEAGRMSIETIDFELPALINRTVAFWRAEASRKGLDLRCDGLESMPEWVAGDPTRLRQILNNLFSNAIKFTDRGEIALSVIPEQRGPYWLMRISVADTGRGMSEQQLSRLFKPFEQTQVSTARTHGGTGLGLAISRELARLMGGDLQVVSAEDAGSVFTLEIGLVEVQHGAEEPVEDIEETRILVVDDHEVNRRAVCLMLEPFGVKLTAAASGADALELLASAPFDVVLMDMNMPGMSGCDATRQLRATPGPNQAAPVIAFTASSEDADLAECEAAGMSGHVVKPIDAHLLHEAIARALSESEAAQNETPRRAAEALG